MEFKIALPKPRTWASVIGSVLLPIYGSRLSGYYMPVLVSPNDGGSYKLGFLIEGGYVRLAETLTDVFPVGTGIKLDDPVRADLFLIADNIVISQKTEGR